MAQIKRNYLFQLIHPTTNVIMEFWPYGTSLESSFDRPGNSFIVPGVNSPIDAVGEAANSIGGRTLAFTIIRPYNLVSGVKETFTEAQDEFKRMVAHGLRMSAVLKTVKGDLRYGRVKLLSLPDRPSQDDDVAAIFTATFDLNPPYWRELYPENAVIYDRDDLTYDLGEHYYDDDGFDLTAAVVNTQIDRLQSTLPDYGSTFTIYGPYGGDNGIRITNVSINPDMFFTIPSKIQANQMLVIECATESVRLNAAPRPDLLVLPQGQFDVMMFEAGIENQIRIECLGANALINGYITIDTVNKYV